MATGPPRRSTAGAEGGVAALPYYQRPLTPDAEESGGGSPPAPAPAPALASRETSLDALATVDIVYRNALRQDEAADYEEARFALLLSSAHGTSSRPPHHDPPPHSTGPSPGETGKPSRSLWMTSAELAREEKRA